MPNLLVHVVVVILVIGVLLWAIENLPAISAPMKQLARVVIVLFTVLYVLAVITGVNPFALPLRR